MDCRVKDPNVVSTPHRFSVRGSLKDFSFPKESKLPSSLQGAAFERKDSFRIGRFCAAQALMSLNPLSSVDVGMNSDGSPQWPEGTVGSITHTAGFSSAAVAYKKDIFSLGIDSEKTSSQEFVNALKVIAVTEREWALQSDCRFSEEQFVTLLFSAKESIYKCVYPLIHRRLEFSDLIVTGIDVASATFHFRFANPAHWPAKFPHHFNSRFEIDGDYIHSGVELH